MTNTSGSDGVIRSVFIYGTLMAPEVFARVVTSSSAIDDSYGFVIHNAVLEEHQRHAVRDREYPGIRPRLGHTVLGMVVTGLTQEQFDRLDVFEGDEYERVEVTVLDVFTQKQLRAYTYLWSAGEDQLLSHNWNFEEFKRRRLDVWVKEEMEHVHLDARRP